MEEKFKTVELKDLENVVLSPIITDSQANRSVNDDRSKVESVNKISKQLSTSWRKHWMKNWTFQFLVIDLHK